ncbi:hypothetical protein [Pseudodesulfovibrio sp.]|uniref:hypothetical protein n=1 Tax=unclassified Pseudodesulfovibrio TaxID=2661612 RepID=UPI003AFF7D7C
MKKIILLLTLLAALLLTTGCSDDTSKSEQSVPASEAVQKANTPKAEPPFTDEEFRKFLADLPNIPGMAAGNPAVTGDELTAQAQEAIRKTGWSDQRFAYVYGHAVAMLSLEQVERTMEEMKQQLETMPKAQQQAMKDALGGEAEKQCQTIRTDVNAMVPASEQTVIRSHMAELRTAFGLGTE